jgi:hypothetical protein
MPRKPPTWYTNGQPCPDCDQVHTRCRGHNRRGTPCMLFPIAGGIVCKRSHGGAAPQTMAAAEKRIVEAEVRGFLQQLGEPEPVDYLVALEELYLGKLQEVRVLRWAVATKQESELTWGVTERSATKGETAGKKRVERAGLSVLLTWMHTAERDLTSILTLCDRAGMTTKRKEYLDRIGASVAIAMQAFVTLIIGELEGAGVKGAPIRVLQDAAPQLARQALMTLATLQESPEGN